MSVRNELNSERCYLCLLLTALEIKPPCKVYILAMLIATVATLREASNVNVMKDILVLVKNALIGTNVS